MKYTGVIQANINVHEALLKSGEYEKSPHRKPESVERVKAIFAKFDQDILNGNDNINHLDVGCGDGFIFECTPKKWTSFGADASSGMLAKCKLNHPEVKLIESAAESINYDNESFDIITCYSFLDHLEYRPEFYKEAYRLLKPGGMVYFGLSPNQIFSNSIALANYTKCGDLWNSDVINSEIQKTHANGEYYKTNFGISDEDLQLCEPGKTAGGGMNPLQEILDLQFVGFKNVQINYTWIMNQNNIKDEISDAIESALPITASAYKYFDILGVKL